MKHIINILFLFAMNIIFVSALCGLGYLLTAFIAWQFIPIIFPYFSARLIFILIFGSSIIQYFTSDEYIRRNYFWKFKK